MTLTVHSVIHAFVHRKIRPFWWRLIGAPRLSRIVDRQFASASPPLPSGDRLRETLRENSERSFFFGARNRKDFFLHLLTQSQDRDSIVSEGEAVVGNMFEAFGSGKIFLGETMDWQKDFLSGHRWPLAQIPASQILDLDRNSDIKVPWELGRFHQVWWLGKAYWVTNNEQYARKFGSLIEDWIAKNPVGQGVQWTIAMESAIRACNWICGFAFFSDSSSLSGAFWEQFARSLFSQGMVIWNNREASLRNGNHYLSNIVGLLFVGLFFRGTALGQRWIRWSVRELQLEMEHQVTADGVDYEKSTAYHRLVLEFFTAAAVLCKVNTFPLAPAFWRRLEKMFAFTAAYTRSDGSAPQIGDSDDGRLFRHHMSGSVHDHRHLLSVGATLFQSPAFRAVAGQFSQDALFFLGAEGFEQYAKTHEQAPETSSMLFPEGGFVVLRSPHIHIMTDVGDIGMKGRGGHGHNDTLAFELWAYGQGFVVDRGTYTYTADAVARQDFRSTRAHNTVVIDDGEIADFNGLWSVREDHTNPRILECSLSSEHDVLVAEHSGYTRLPNPVVHRRRFDFHKRSELLTITDDLMGQGSHSVTLRFHVHPDITCSSDAPDVWKLRGMHADIHLQTDGEAIRDESWFSPSYGTRVPMTVLVIQQQLSLPAQLKTTIRIVPHTS